MALTHLVVRRAEPAELLDVARVRVASWREAYAGLVPDAELEGTGAGYSLMTGTIEGLREQGYDAVSLWVLSGNARGIAFYERQGFAPTGEVTASSVDALPESRYSRRI